MHYPTDAATRSLAVLIFFTALSGDFWRNLLGEWGSLALVAAIVVVTATMMTRRRLWSKLVVWRLPRTLLLIGLIGVASIAWSGSPGTAAVVVLTLAAGSLGALFISTALSWPQILAALAGALCWVLGLSLVLEVIAAVFVRAPVPAFWVGAGAPAWTDASLFTGGPLQGIPGDPRILALDAVLAVIVIGVQAAQNLRRRNPAAVWLAIAIALLASTHSVTAVAVLVVAGIALGVLVLGRRAGAGRRLGVLAAIAVVTAAGAIVYGVFRTQLLAFVTASDGAPLDGTAAATPIDVWGVLGAQLGVGLIVLFALIVSTWHRAWWFAVDQPLDSLGLPIPRVRIAFAPALLVVVIVTQSLAQNPSFVAAAWMLLVIVSITTKSEQSRVSLDLGNGEAWVNPLPSRSALAIRVPVARR